MATDDLPTSRRNLAQIAAAGLVTAAAVPVFAQSSAAASLTGSQPLRDPAKQYPGPPFLPQTQPWPGLASKMTPKPDHGEKSYVGSSKLAGRKALITGGDSGIGRAAAIAFAREGADVAISYYPSEEPDAQEVVQLIRQAGRKAVALPGDIRDKAFCGKMVNNAVAGLGGLDLLVSKAARQHTASSIMDISTDYFD